MVNENINSSNFSSTNFQNKYSKNTNIVNESNSYVISAISRGLSVNRRMPKCNSVLQAEKGLFQTEIRPNFPENSQISALFLNSKYPKDV